MQENLKERKSPFVLNTRRAIGLRLRELREERRMSLEEVAELSGLTVNNIHRVECARYSTTLDVLASLCEVYNVTLCLLQ